MLGNSDEGRFLEESGDEENGPLEITSQELRRLRMLERLRQSTQIKRACNGQGEEPDTPSGTDCLTSLPPSSPPWPTPLSASEPEDDAPKTCPLPGMRQPAVPTPPLPPTPPAVLPAATRRHTEPLPLLQGDNDAATSLPPPYAGAFSLPGWRSFRQHSYWLIPLFLVAAFFLLLLVVHSREAGPLLFVFAAIGVLQSAILLYAPSDAFWAVAVVGGFLLFLAVTFFALFLPIFAVILSILLLSLGGVALRERYYPVKEGTVVVMSLFGRYNRTLQPGFNLRAPGEKVLGVVETQRIRYEAHIPPVTLFSGEQVTLSVAMSYQIVPGQEYLAIRMSKDWQKAIQQELGTVVEDVVSTLSIDDFRRPPGAHQPQEASGVTSAHEIENQGISPLERINERLTSAMREQVADRGVAIHAVKAHVIEGPRLPGNAGASSHPMLATHSPVVVRSEQPGVGRIVEGANLSPSQAMPSLPPVANTGSMETLASGAPLADMPGQVASPYPSGVPAAPLPIGAVVSSGDVPSMPLSLLSAQALAETYDAVVHQRITDLETIRRIIAQFEAVAADPELSPQVPFDAAAGARNLLNHLRRLERHSLSRSPQQQSGDAASPPDALVSSPGPEEH
jgi:hypothetical protein